MNQSIRSGLVAGLMICFTLVAAAAPVSRDDVVNIGGQNLHIRILGDNGPTIVFEAGLGNDMSTWRPVAQAVARFAQVVLYDRAGLGGSLPLARANTPITAADVATALHLLLKKTGLRPPFILVGHSLGGLYVQMFARRYPREIAGVVLLDSSSSDAPAGLKTRARLEPGSAAYLEEAGTATSNDQVRHAGPFPAVPLMVVAATDHGPFFKSWEPVLMELQRRLADLSPKGRLLVARGSGHYIQTDRPALVVSAIRSAVSEVDPRQRNGVSAR
ncbi:MAG TPA: alpha/beta hydrolase [Stellaceae bacterium]|nr:alpha/beta hydrolase [Stellaceae bacterium]